MSRLLALILAVTAAPLAAQTTVCVSVGLAGTPAQGQRPSISDDGRYVSFESNNAGIVANDTNGSTDIFLRDRVAGTTERVSLDSADAQISGISFSSAVSGDGRYVAFVCSAPNIVPGDNNAFTDVFVRDRVAGTTTLASVPQAGGIITSGGCDHPVLSADGRYVAFDSTASNLVAGDGGFADIFVRDRVAGTTERISQTAGGTGGNADSIRPHISGDGRWVVFATSATNLVPSAANGLIQILRKDRQTGALDPVSVSSFGGAGDDNSFMSRISDDGRWVSFDSFASNLVSGTSGFDDVFLRDMLLGQTRLLSVTPAFAAAGFGGANPSLSGDGRRVAFESSSQDLAAPDVGSFSDVFTRDLGTNLTTLQSVSTAGVQGDSSSTGDLPNNGGIALSRDGRWLAFDSLASNFAPGDAPSSHDVFLRGPFPVAPATWTTNGPPLGGFNGKPLLQGQGALAGGSNAALMLSSARPSSPVALIVGATALFAPFKGGTFVPDANLLLFLSTSSGGTLLLPFVWPVGVPAGTHVWLQDWVTDPSGPKGFTASNGLEITAP
jgi:Tol biopolymer transport system component